MHNCSQSCFCHCFLIVFRLAARNGQLFPILLFALISSCFQASGLKFGIIVIIVFFLLPYCFQACGLKCTIIPNLAFRIGFRLAAWNSELLSILPFYCFLIVFRLAAWNSELLWILLFVLFSCCFQACGLKCAIVPNRGFLINFLLFSGLRPEVRNCLTRLFEFGTCWIDAGFWGVIWKPCASLARALARPCAPLFAGSPARKLARSAMCVSTHWVFKPTFRYECIVARTWHHNVAYAVWNLARPCAPLRAPSFTLLENSFVLCHSLRALARPCVFLAQSLARHPCAEFRRLAWIMKPCAPLRAQGFTLRALATGFF